MFNIKIRPKCTVALMWFHSFFSRKKSEIWIAFTFFEKWKVKSFSFSLFSRNEKWIDFWFHSFREVKVKLKSLEIEIERWNMKKILQISRETRLSQVAGPEWERPPYFSRHRKILILFPPKYSFVILVLVHVPLGHLLPHILWHNPPHFWTFAVPFFRCGSISSIYWLDSTSCQK